MPFNKQAVKRLPWPPMWLTSSNVYTSSKPRERSGDSWIFWLTMRPSCPSSTLLKLDEWEWNRCLEVNLKGTFFMSQLCGRVMVDENQERGGGVIINIALYSRREFTT